MIIFRNNCKGIISEFCFKSENNITTALILCDGLPNAPKNKELLETLAEKGYLVFYPRYRGTWESEGEFLKENPVLDIYEIVSLIKQNEISELWEDRIFKFNIKKIIVIGVSFGGAVALSCAKNPLIDKVIALSPIFSFRAFNINKNEQDLVHLGTFMSKAFINGYRMNLINWGKLVKGDIFNPLNDLDQENVGKVTLLQSTDDTTVNPKYVKDYAKNLGITLKLYEGKGHFSFSKLTSILDSDIIPLIKK